MIPLYSQRGGSVCESRTNLRLSPTHAGEVSCFSQLDQPIYSAFPILIFAPALVPAAYLLLYSALHRPCPLNFQQFYFSPWAGMGMAKGEGSRPGLFYYLYFKPLLTTSYVFILFR